MEREILILIKIQLINRDVVYCDVFRKNDYKGISEYIAIHAKGAEAYIETKSFYFASPWGKIVIDERGFSLSSGEPDELESQLDTILDESIEL